MPQFSKLTKSIAFIVSIFAISLSLGYLVFAWTEPGSAPPAGNVSAPLNASSTSQTKTGPLGVTSLFDSNNPSYFIDPSGDLLGNAAILNGNVDLSGKRIINLPNIPGSGTDAVNKNYVDAASGPSCPDNYANLCSNGGGLTFTYGGKTLHIDAFPRSTYIVTGVAESQYGLALGHCETIGARLPTLSEWAAACTALSGPSGNGETTFGGNIAGRWEWTATPDPGSPQGVGVAGSGSCAGMTNILVHDGNSARWFRCVR